MAIIIDEFRLTPLPRGWVCHACGRDPGSDHVVIATATCRFPAFALWKARRELRRAIRARRGDSPLPPVAPLLLALLLLVGCAQPPADPVPAPHVDPVSEQEFRRMQQELRDELKDEIRRAMQAPPPPPVDLSPVLSELKQLRQTNQATRYTGCKVFVDADDFRCIPCARAKRDLRRLAGAGKWRVGEDASAHFWLHLEENPEGPTPRFEFWRDGQVVAVIEDYGSTPREVDRQDGFEGPIHTLIDACQRYCSPSGRSPRRTSTGTTFSQTADFGASYGAGYGSSTGFGYGTGYGSTGGQYTSGSSVGGYGYSTTVYGSEGGSFSPSRVRYRWRGF